MQRALEKFSEFLTLRAGSPEGKLKQTEDGRALD